MHVLLVGAGNMSIEYAKVLSGLKVDFSVISRGVENAKKFKIATGKEVITGGLENKYNDLLIQPTHAIVVTTLESLVTNSVYLLERGIGNLLIEKPGAVDNIGLQKIFELSQINECKTYIGYNRRFYSSVIKAEQLIKAEGGLQSFIFEFTEWSHKIKELQKTEIQFNNWFIGNSTHVLDLAFYFGGKPKEISSFVSGGSEWHPRGMIFTGGGVTEKDLLFSYHANWEAPGSWKLELLTKQNRYIFRPLEELKFKNWVL
jgi:predicted dehydrogenase